MAMPIHAVHEPEGASASLRMAALKRFGGYKPMDETSVRDVSSKPGLAMEKLRDLWRKVRSYAPDNFSRNTEHAFQERYNIMHRALKGHDLTPKDISDASFMLGVLRQEDGSLEAGLFLSALINTGKGRRYLISTGQLGCGWNGKAEYVGYKNTKDLTISGCGGIYAGFAMRKGSITILGDAEFGLGESMIGGRIVVEGSVKDSAGAHMLRGRIIIKGNTGVLLGNFMEGGKIIVLGKAGRDVGCFMKGGEIIIAHGRIRRSDHWEGGRILYRKNPEIEE